MSNLYRIVFAGFGGQGVMSMGQLLTYAGMIEEKNVSWCPSYGPEMRGGTANCSVIISDELITSPVIANNATTAVIMNEASYDKFVNSVIPGGSIYINSSLVKRKVQREDVKVYYVPANDIAKEIDVPKEDVVMALEAIQDPISLFEPIYHDGGDAVFVVDQVRDDKNTDETWLEHIALKEALKKLNKRERRN